MEIMGVDLGNKKDKPLILMISTPKNKKGYFGGGGGGAGGEMTIIYGISMVVSIESKLQKIEKRYFKDLEEWEKEGEIPTLIDQDCTVKQHSYEKLKRELEKYKLGKTSELEW